MANEKRLIDANAFIENIKKQYCEECYAQGNDYKEIVCRACNIDDIRIDIEDAHTVDAVEVAHGRWLYDSGTERHFCSACNEYAISVITNTPVYEYDWEENLQFSHIEADCDEQLTNFCPNCGAKMYGGNEDG